MRNMIGSGALLFAAALAGCGAGDELTGPAAGASLTAAATPVEAVTGSAHTFQAAVGGGFVRRRLTFTATRREDGTVDGSWQLVAGAAIVRGSITCFTIVGDAVRVGGVVESSLFSTFVEGSDTGWYLEDNGEGAGDEDIGGRLIFNGAAGTADSYCAGTYTDPRVETVSELYGGNVQVHR